MESTTTPRVAIVTGAGKGIGAAVLRGMAEDGYEVVAMSPSGAAKDLAESLGGAGLAGSVECEADLRSLVDLAMTRHGRIDVVVNGAGHAAKGGITEITDDEWRQGVDMYLMSVIRITRLVLPIMESQGTGTIVNISTSSPFEPNAKFPVSATVRAALAAYTKLFANEYGPSGIRMNNVLPGFTKEDPSTVPPEWTASIPLRRAAAATEVAHAVRFLASPASSYITGQNMRVDGGVTRSV